MASAATVTIVVPLAVIAPAAADPCSAPTSGSCGTTAKPAPITRCSSPSVTFGDCNVPEQDWRKNTLFRSSDRILADGMTVPPSRFDDIYASSPVLRDTNHQLPNFSRQVIDSLRLTATEVTVIPTAGISVGTRQYVNFMS